MIPVVPWRQLGYVSMYARRLVFHDRKLWLNDPSQLADAGEYSPMLHLLAFQNS